MNKSPMSKTKIRVKAKSGGAPKTDSAPDSAPATTGAASSAPTRSANDPVTTDATSSDPTHSASDPATTGAASSAPTHSANDPAAIAVTTTATTSTLAQDQHLQSNKIRKIKNQSNRKKKLLRTLIIIFVWLLIFVLATYLVLEIARRIAPFDSIADMLRWIHGQF